MANINNHVFNDCVMINKDELKTAPFKANDPNDPDINNGLITTIWGPHVWESFNVVAFDFPVNPTEQEKKDYLEHYLSWGNVLPCSHCRKSYKQFINEDATLLNMNTMESRKTLTTWVFNVHNAVNNKLGVDYGETYEEFCYKYESYRAKCIKNEKGCVMPLSMKAESYKKSEIHRAPIIDKKYCYALRNHAKKIGMNKFDEFINFYTNIERNSQYWTMRDCAVRKLIGDMRKKGINALDRNGLPSYEEMRIISFMSSTIDKKKLDEIYEKIISNNNNNSY